MAIITYPLNNIDYEAADAELYNSTRTSGVYANSDNLDISVTGDREVTVSPGIAWIKNDDFKGKAVGVTENVILSFDIADSILDRIDRVVLQFDAAANGTSLIVKKGEASSSPAPPARITTASLYELVLCDVSIPHGMTALTAANITDQRANDELCGLMADGVTRLTSGTINGKPLGGDITLTAADVGAVPTTRTVNGKALSGDITLAAADVGAQVAITGGASTITTSNLTASRALVSNASGKVAVSAVTSTQLGYLSGVTSAIQTQLDAKMSNAQTSLTSGMTYSNATNVSSYVRKVGNVGFLTLAIKITSTIAAGTALCTIPAGYRPNGTVYGLIGNGTVQPISINTSGVVALYNKGCNSSDVVWCGQIAYIVGN